MLFRSNNDYYYLDEIVFVKHSTCGQAWSCPQTAAAAAGKLLIKHELLFFEQIGVCKRLRYGSDHVTVQ